MGQLPVGWVSVSLGNLAQYINGKGFKKNDWKTDGIPIIRIQNLNKLTAEFNYGDDTHEEKYRVGNGDLLVAWSASLGAYIWNRGDAWLNQHIFRVAPEKALVDKQFLYFLIKDSIEALYNKTHGMGMVHVTKGKFEGHEVLLPPLNEQIRIANKLDSLLAKVEAAQTRLDKIPTLLKRFRQAVLAAATSGELTKEWRETEINWAKVTLGEVGSAFNYGSSTKSQKEGSIPVLRMGNIQSGKLDWTKLVYTSDIKEIEKYKLEKGDVLFNRTNSPELVGKTAIYNGEQQAIFAGYLIKVKGTDKLDSEYLNIQLNSPHARDYCWKVKTDGVSQSNINAKKLQAYEFFLPPIEEQKQIVHQVESLFTLADKVEKQYQQARQRTDKLTQSLLAKAFKGELVPQDPNDEPAEKLLARIQAEREKLEPVKKVRKNRVKKQA